MFYFESGREDSNLRPSAPKADALAGLRYAPKSGTASIYKRYHTNEGHNRHQQSTLKRFPNHLNYTLFFGVCQIKYKLFLSFFTGRAMLFTQLLEWTCAALLSHDALRIWGFCLGGFCLGISADFCGFLQVRRKTSQFVGLKHCVFREISSNKMGCSQNCVHPEL